MLRVNGVEIEDTFAEAFKMRAARAIVTAETAGWARTAATLATVSRTSVRRGWPPVAAASWSSVRPLVRHAFRASATWMADASPVTALMPRSAMSRARSSMDRPRRRANRA